MEDNETKLDIPLCFAAAGLDNKKKLNLWSGEEKGG